MHKQPGAPNRNQQNRIKLESGAWVCGVIGGVRCGGAVQRRTGVILGDLCCRSWLGRWGEVQAMCSGLALKCCVGSGGADGNDVTGDWCVGSGGTVVWIRLG